MKLWRWLRRQVIGPFHDLKRPEFPADQKLLLRIAAQKDLLGDIPIKANRDYLERRPIDFEGLPNG